MKTTISYSYARQNLKKVLDSVNDRHEPIVIQRPKGKAVVIVDLDDYQSMDETAYLLSNSINRKRIFDAIAQKKAGKGIQIDSKAYLDA